MKVSVYEFKTGNKLEEIDLPSEIFDNSFNEDLVHQVVVSQYANQRKNIAHTKDRGEVKGGGKKPWRQKGTGRARHGSIRSPIWKGGGIVGGPDKNKKYEKKIPVRMRRKVLLSILSKKAKEKELFVFDNIDIEDIKTKQLEKFLSYIRKNNQEILDNKSILFLISSNNKKFFLSCRNLENTGAVRAKDLSPLKAVNYKYLFIDKKGIEEIKNTFLKK